MITTNYSLTAWETLFARFRLDAASRGTVLVLAAAGGVGSMVVQLARTLTGLTVIGTASRPESRQWALDLGAHHVVNHHDLVPAVRDIAPHGVGYVFSPHTAGPINADTLRRAHAMVEDGHMTGKVVVAGF